MSKIRMWVILSHIAQCILEAFLTCSLKIGKEMVVDLCSDWKSVQDFMYVLYPRAYLGRGVRVQPPNDSFTVKILKLQGVQDNRKRRERLADRIPVFRVFRQFSSIFYRLTF